MQKKLAGELCRTTVVCVDGYERGNLTGSMYNPGCGRLCEFHSLTRFLTEMERLLDDLALPQSFTAARRFVHRAEAPPAQTPGERPLSGRLATFSVRILFRQNASWQGTVKWLEGGMEESFRSALELILLMDSALKDGAVEQAV